jgi:heavy metal sensor kinase
MSLRTRVSAFFLTALAAVLFGFSLALYWAARARLQQELHDRLTASLNLLMAALEVTADGIEWEPHERHLTLGRDGGPEQVRWELRDGAGRIIDRSDKEMTEPLKPNPHGDVNFLVTMEYSEQKWWTAGTSVGKRGAAAAAGKYPFVSIAVGVDPQPMQATLKRLAWTLIGLSAGVWCGAALVGHWLCRRALAPVTRMATAARTMKATNLEETLPAPGTRDELDDLGRAFNDLLGRLREAYERQRRFTGDASHELRTPLTAMLGQVEVALRRDRPAEDYRQTLTTVREQADHLRRIVEALLFLARADAEGAVDVLEVIDLSTWLPEHVKRWAEHDRTMDLHVQLKETSAMPVRAQSVLLGQLVDNLLDNAFKYSEAGKPVTMVLRRDAGDVVLEVIDAGAGIDAHDLAHVFDPFYRTGDARRRAPAGIGLGLAVARRIAGVFGASLVADSTPGRGSCFRVRWPAATSSPTSSRSAG